MQKKNEPRCVVDKQVQTNVHQVLCYKILEQNNQRSRGGIKFNR